MNFLAHIYLSGISDERMMIGNFIGDKVKGKQIEEYPADIRRGLLIHREIDSYTDTHEVTSRIKRRFQNVAGHYSGVVTDIVYDYCLAKTWEKWYNKRTLSRFSIDCYMILIKNWYCIPSEMHQFVIQFISTRRLTNYAHESGVESTLKKMHNSKDSFPDISREVRKIVHEDYSEILKDFEEFFPQIKEHIREYKKKLYKTIV